MNAPDPNIEPEIESTGLPLFPTWRRVYIFVVVYFAFVVSLLILLERAFA